MKNILFVVLMVLSASSYASTWVLIHSEYVLNTGWICTYQLQGSNYQTTIINGSEYCKSFIFQ